MVTYIGSRVQLCCREGGTMQTNITGMCGECLQCMDHTGFAPAHGTCAFPVYTAQGPGSSERQLTKAGRALHAFPRSKLLRFRFFGTLQRHRHSWASVLCPYQVQAARATRCLVNTLCQVCLITSLVPATRFPGCAARAISLVYCVSLLGSCFQAVTILADVKHPGSQEDLVSN